MKNILFGMMAAAMLFSCTATSSVSKVGKSQPSISGTKWILADQVKGKMPTLNIDGSKITGNAGCNNFFGEVVLNTSAGVFSAGNVGTTKMFCDNMAVENNFLKMLSEANKYVVNGNTLELYKDGLLLLKLNKQ